MEKVYTQEDLERARANVRHWEAAIDRYMGNNPNKYEHNLRLAHAMLRKIGLEMFAKSDSK